MRLRQIGIFICLFLPGMASGVEIPLDRTAAATAVDGSVPTTTAIGYVDMEKVFAEHPMTRRLKEAFIADVEIRKKEMAGLQAEADALQQVILSSTTELAQLRSELTVLKLTLGYEAVPQSIALTTAPIAELPVVSSATADVPVQLSTSPVPSAVVDKMRQIAEKEAGIDTLRTDLDARRAGLDTRLRQNRDDVAALEEKNTAAVLADLYAIIQRIAEEDGIAVILDKNNVLCGQTCRDMTPRVLERLKGR